ncbi:hypothetical protein ES702_00417 [subsurface metagenome]
MRTFLSHDATARKSPVGENARSETLSEGGSDNAISFERSPEVLAEDAAAEALPKIPDMLVLGLLRYRQDSKGTEGGSELSKVEKMLRIFMVEEHVGSYPFDDRAFVFKTKVKYATGTRSVVTNWKPCGKRGRGSMRG